MFGQMSGNPVGQPSGHTDSFIAAQDTAFTSSTVFSSLFVQMRMLVISSEPWRRVSGSCQSSLMSSMFKDKGNSEPGRQRRVF